jgi:uncharacterized protein (TIGR02001 family)
MKKLVGLVLLVACLVSAAAASIVDLNAAYVSKYIWRGYDSNGTQPAIQPGATFYIGETGLSLGLWGSYNLGDLTNKELTEVDYTVTYSSSCCENWAYSVYYSTYNYPVTPGANTGELFLSLTGNALLFKPTLTCSYDNDKGKGTYLSLALKNPLPAGPLTLDTSLTIGYDGGQYGAKAGLSDANLAVSTAIPVSSLTVTPTLNYTAINKDTGRVLDNLFWFSLNVATGI